MKLIVNITRTASHTNTIAIMPIPYIYLFEFYLMNVIKLVVDSDYKVSLIANCPLFRPLVVQSTSGLSRAERWSVHSCAWPVLEVSASPHKGHFLPSTSFAGQQTISWRILCLLLLVIRHCQSRQILQFSSISCLKLRSAFRSLSTSVSELQSLMERRRLPKQLDDSKGGGREVVK